MKFAFFDGDDVGAVIEVSLMDDDVSEACLHSESVSAALLKVVRELKSNPQVVVLFSGGDDILATWPNDAMDNQDVEQLRDLFKTTCGRTMSVGVGNSGSEALRNLRRAKLSGKNRIVSSNEAL